VTGKKNFLACCAYAARCYENLYQSPISFRR